MAKGRYESLHLPRGAGPETEFETQDIPRCFPWVGRQKQTGIPLLVTLLLASASFILVYTLNMANVVIEADGFDANSKWTILQGR